MRSIIFTFLLGLAPATAWGQLEFEREPINYSKTAPSDAVYQLSQEIAAGNAELKWDDDHGYLKAILKNLDVPIDSQTLVFTKTSLQVHRISPQTPRAIYFNDDIYVGWVQRGEVIEISAADTKLGTAFYSVTQDENVTQPIQRETTRCLHCHASTHTRRTPGHIMRSVFPNSTGRPEFRLGSYRTDDRSEFTKRWGGWYVTGTHGDQRHMGNVFLPDPDVDEDLDVEAGANVTDLSSTLNLSTYLTPHSDIVALMVLQHQIRMHNALAAASIAGRVTAHDSVVMNKILERPSDFESESTQRRYESAAESVVKAMLFVDEAELTSPVQGTSQFATNFAKRGPFDSKRRSLREFNLKRRLFKYPCSFLVYSDAFKELPAGVMTCVKSKLSTILSGDDNSEEYDHLSADDCVAIREILDETTELKLNRP